MEPLDSKVKQAILDANPDALPEDIEEYERLLSSHFSKDPDFPADAAFESEHLLRLSRLSDLHRKLFPGRYKRE